MLCVFGHLHAAGPILHLPEGVSLSHMLILVSSLQIG